MISGWGNFPSECCNVALPQRDVDQREAILGADQASWIARGLGRAYGDSALNRDQGVLVQTSRNHFLAFDEHAGVLQCESGVSFAEIIEHLLPRGWFLPTTPGTKFVTVGGAIAADVHGKNHHADGSFGNFVTSFELLTGCGDIITCSRTENPDIFWATIGGMGLTGVILRARFQLAPVATAYCAVNYRRTRNLDETLDLIAESNAAFRYSVAWIDCLSGGAGLGRSVLMLANDAQPSELPASLTREPLLLPRKRHRSCPFDLPHFVLNGWSVKLFNAIYYGGQRSRQSIVDFDRFFYPLDNLHHWNRIYGRRGFVQYQALFPPETSRAGLRALLTRIVASRRASFLAVLKSSGPANAAPLSYMHPGHTLALDFPNTGADLRPFMTELDEILLKFNGRLYLAKDALTSADAFAVMYPRLAEFRAMKARIDPTGRFASSQARRLGIV